MSEKSGHKEETLMLLMEKDTVMVMTVPQADRASSSKVKHMIMSRMVNSGHFGPSVQSVTQLL